jgi:hypothetical protein
VSPDDFFDDDWEEPSRTQDTAVTRPAGDAGERARGGAAGQDPPRPAEPVGPAGERRPPRRAGSRVPQQVRLPRLPKFGGGSTTLPPLEYRRLAGLGLGILAVIVVLVLLARSCSGSSTKSSNEDYVATLTAQVLKPSDDVAARFRKTFELTRAPLTLVSNRLATQLADMRAVQKKAANLKPTKQLEPYQPALLQALQLRVTGLQCMSERIRRAWTTKPVTAAGEQLYPCTGELNSSDYVYADFFANGANAALKSVGAAGVPTSQFLSKSQLDMLTPAGMGLTMQRLHPGPVHGLHGTAIGSVVASPAGTTLQPGTLNRVDGNDKLVFVVSVQNSGKFTEVGVNVRLTLKRSSGGGAVIEKTESIPSIAPGATEAARFPGLFASSQTAPDFSVQYRLTVSSLKVPGEKRLDNNTATYNVQFSIAS